MNKAGRRRQFDFSWADPEGRKFRLALGEKTFLMGVLNLTPDSFYDGGRYKDPARAVGKALRMEEEGADIIDIGGESSRPGASPVTAEEELRRVLPVISELRGRLRVPISIDTVKAPVARAALESGAQIVNDISAFRSDPGMMEVLAAYSGPVVLMHMKGTPRDMQANPEYEDVISEIKDFLGERVERAVAGGVDRDRIILDPGIGFGKNLEHNLRIIGRLNDFDELARPLLIGPSRKSFIGMVLHREAEERIWGTAGAVASAVLRGAHIIRVHDVGRMREVVAVVDAILREEQARSAG